MFGLIERLRKVPLALGAEIDILRKVDKGTCKSWELEQVLDTLERLRNYDNGITLDDIAMIKAEVNKLEIEESLNKIPQL